MILYRLLFKLKGKKKYRCYRETFDKASAYETLEYFKTRGVDTKIIEVHCH